METHETIHSSVLQQTELSPIISDCLQNHPNLVCPLSPLEEQIKRSWPYDPNSPEAKAYADKIAVKAQTPPASPSSESPKPTSWVDGFKGLIRSVSKRGSSTKETVQRTTAVERRKSKGTNVVITSTTAKAPLSRELPQSSSLIKN